MYVYEGARPFVVEQHGRLGDVAHAQILDLAGDKARTAALGGQSTPDCSFARATRDTVVSKIITPEIYFLSELIRRAG